MSNYLHNCGAPDCAIKRALSFSGPFSLVLFFVLMLASLDGRGQKVWDGEGAQDNWNDPANWSPDGVPVASDNVTIALNTIITVDVSNAVCNSLQLGGATMNGTAGILTFSSTGSPKLTVSGTITIGGSGNAGNSRRGEIIFVSGATLEAGSIVLTQSTMGADAPGIITMTASSVLRTGSFAVGQGNANWTPGAGTVELSMPNTLPGAPFTTFHNLSILSGVTTFGAEKTITGKLSISVAGQASLFPGSNSIVTVLNLGGVGQNSGTYGGIGSVAANVNPTYFTATDGLITVDTDCSNSGLWTALSSTNWSDASNWCGSLPTAATDVLIPDGEPVTINTAAVCSSLTIAGGNQGNAVSFNSGSSLTVAGAVTIDASTDDDIDRYIEVNDGTLTCGAILMASTANDNRDIEVTVTTGTITVLGNITMNGIANRNAIRFLGAGVLNIRGSITGGDIDGVAPGCTVNFNGTSSQTIPINTSYVYDHIVVNNTAGATFQAGVTAANVTGNITVGNLVSGSLLNTNNVAMTRGAADTITVASGSTFNAGTTPITWSGIDGAVIINGVFSTSDTLGFSGMVNTAISSTNNPSIVIGANSTIEFSAVAPFIQVVTQRTDYRNLRLSGGVKTMAGGTFAIAKDLTINTAIYNGDTNNPVLNLSGDLINNAFIFNQGNGRINFIGTSLQTIGGSSTPVYDTLVLNNAGAVLSAPVTVRKKFIFTKGILTTTNTHVLIFKDDATASANDTSFVSGPVRKVGNFAFTFPTGKGSTYGPISISAPLVSTDAFQAEYFATAPTGNLDMSGIFEITDEEYWDIDRIGGASAIRVIMDFTGNSMADGTDLGNLRVARFNEAMMMWVSEGNSGTTGSPATQGTITSDPIGSFSFFTLGSSVALNPLPVELEFFKATPEGNAVQLDWRTASELNNAFFEIERGANGRDFERIGKMAGAGNSHIALDYGFTDILPLSGWNYYRLRQEDWDGQFAYSQVQAVWVDGAPDEIRLLLFPNPAGNELWLKTNEPIQPGDQVEIYDYTGKRVLRMPAGEAFRNVVDVSGLSAGAYLARVLMGSDTINASFVKH